MFLCKSNKSKYYYSPIDSTSQPVIYYFSITRSKDELTLVVPCLLLQLHHEVDICVFVPVKYLQRTI